MASYTVTDPQSGRKLTLTGDSPPSESELNDIFTQTSSPAPTSPAAPPVSQPGLIRRGWDAMGYPEAKSREGLDAVARGIARITPQVEPTGNLPADLALNTPSILTNTVAEGAAKIAPSFISRGSMLMSGGLGALKAASPVGRALGKAAEGWSGLEYKTPGILNEAANDAGLITAPGRDAAGKLYEAAVDRGNIAPELREAMTHKDLVDEAKQAMAAGTLTPEGALVARQSLDAIKRSMPTGNFLELRDAFDSIAKNVSAEADAAFVRGIKADALRSPLPVNKGGGTSIAKSVIAKFAGWPALIASSPAVQGAVATGLGAAARSSFPGAIATGAATSSLMRRLQSGGK